ncbi:MAG: T9SS type A sorting domain-containing protein [Bacteroidetes bacterium]|nr:T9SS type A sorting domain-containing protein [Bacteroidota bacterium]
MTRRLLLSLTLLLLLPLAAQAQQAWINEFHYDNSGTDTGEFIEVIGQGITPADIEVVLYNGSTGAVYDTQALSTFTATPLTSGYVAYDKTLPTNGIQNGAPDGIALCTTTGTVVQFLSYEGTFTATDGCASGMGSTDIGVSETSSTPAGASLGLTGTGSAYADFTWTTFSDDSPGALNDGQAFSIPTFATDVWFNEVHYQDSNDPTDTFLELVVGASVSGTDFNNISVVLYDADTGAPLIIPPGLPGAGSPAILPLSNFTAGQTVGDFTFYTFEGDTAPLFAAPGDALALCYDVGGAGEAILTNGGAVQFFGQQGTMAATAGCAAGRTSTDLGFFEDETTEPGSAIGLTNGSTTPAGGGDSFTEFEVSDFSFIDTNLATSTPGSPNFGQAIFVEATCPVPFGVPGVGFYAVSPDANEFVDYSTNGGENLSDLYFILIDGANGDVYYNLDITGSAGPLGNYRIGASGVAGTDQAIPDGTIQDGPDVAAVVTRNVPLGTDAASLGINEICSYLIYLDNNNIYFNYQTLPASKRGTDEVDLPAILAEAVAQAETQSLDVPTSYALEQNYPNPFNPTTTIRFDLPEAADVSLTVYDMLGREVRRLATGTMEAGTHTVTFTADGLPSGMYVYRLDAGAYQQTRRMVLLK